MIRRSALALLAVSIFSLGFAATAADEKKEDPKKEVKLEGKITCAKCDLGVADSCATVIVVKEKDKEVTYYFDKDAHKKNHGATCSTPKDGIVKGTVKKDGDKMIITVKDLEYKK